MLVALTRAKLENLDETCQHHKDKPSLDIVYEPCQNGADMDQLRLIQTVQLWSTCLAEAWFSRPGQCYLKAHNPKNRNIYKTEISGMIHTYLIEVSFMNRRKNFDWEPALCGSGYIYVSRLYLRDCIT